MVVPASVKKALVLLARKRQQELDWQQLSLATQRKNQHQRLRVLLALAHARAQQKRRREVERADGGWAASTLAGYLNHGDEITYRYNFRMTKASVNMIIEKLSAARYLTTNTCRNPKLRVTAAFKVAVCLYFMAHGKGSMKVVGDAASLGESTVRLYLEAFCAGVLAVLRPIYMPATKPTAAHVQRVREQFAYRRGIANVAMACDGTHVPFKGGPDYRNYKGWESILVLGFVDSYHLFVDADVGAAGRSGDNTVLKYSWLLARINEDPVGWLGEDGVIAADGGASDGCDRLLNGFAAATEPEDCYFNFCLSSTRFFVEEVFGRWKNRFRFLLAASDLDHRMLNLLIYVSMVLHNLCTIRKDDAIDFDSGSDEDWEAFHKEYARHACPSCVRRNALHCVHAARNRCAAPAKGATAAALRDQIKAALWNELVDDDVRAQMVARARTGFREGD